MIVMHVLNVLVLKIVVIVRILLIVVFAVNVNIVLTALIVIFVNFVIIVDVFNKGFIVTRYKMNYSLIIVFLIKE